MNFLSEFIINKLKTYHSETNTEEIDELIEKGIFKVHSNGLLYGLIEPEVDDYPDSCILMCYGAGTVYNSLLSLTDNFDIKDGKNRYLNVKIFVFQYFGKYKSIFKVPSPTKDSGCTKDHLSFGQMGVNVELTGNDDYELSIQTSLEIIKATGVTNIRTIGYSFGCYGAAKYSNGLSGLICPFNVTTDTFGLCSSEIDCAKAVSEGNRFLILFGTDDDCISSKTVDVFSRMDNCRVDFYDGTHSIVDNYHKFMKAMVYTLLV